MKTEQEKKFDINKYRPLKEEDVLGLGDLPIPTRDFTPGGEVKWNSTINLAGTIFINVIHQDYPDAFCQMQCVQDDNGRWNIFFQHVSPSNHHIPDDLADELAPEIFVQAMEQFQRGKLPC